MALSAMAVKQAKPKEKIYILKDEHGLYLEVGPSGGRWWRLRYWIQGKENRISLDTYPVVTLAEAREKCLEAKKLIAAGQDPSQSRKLEKSPNRWTSRQRSKPWPWRGWPSTGLACESACKNDPL